MAEFEKLMAASARPSLLDSHEASSRPAEGAGVMTPERAAESRHMNALGLTPPRSLLSSFSAAAAAGAASRRLLLTILREVLVLKQRSSSASICTSCSSAAAPVFWTLLLHSSCAWESAGP